VKKALEIALGVVTSIGGFLEIGSLVTSMQAGAEYRFSLIWVLVLGTACSIALVEMAGRLAAVSKRTIAAALRERFGFNIFCVVLVGVGLSTLLVLVAELGGICLAMQLATGVSFPWWAAPVSLGVWALLWKGRFNVIEYGVSLLGLVTLAFVLAAVRLHPPVGELVRGLAPPMSMGGGARYWFLAVSILGATLTPYLFFFYSSGAIEDRWDASHLAINRVVAVGGMGFGGSLSVAVLVVSALVFAPSAIRVDHYAQAALVLAEPLGRWGYPLFVASLGIACLGAALEVTLALTYLVAQGFGWQWGENLKPRQAARFVCVYTGLLAVAAAVAASGLDPLKVTVFAMALASAILPAAVVPFIVLMNDRHYLGEHRNGWLGNGAVLAIVGLAFGLAIVSIPLEILGG
jgi:Mn2+/Fe2+ NRAMP family transporter